MSSKIRYDGISLLETECAFKFQNGKSFTTESGAWILELKDTGLFIGILYAYPKESKVGSWDGSLKIPALFLNEWYSNMGDRRQLVHFEYQWRRFSGTYYKSNSDLVRIRELADNER